MFDNKLKALIEKLEDKVDDMWIKFVEFKNTPVPDYRQEVKNEVEARLLQFHTEVMRETMESLEKIMRDHREISLVETLAANMRSEDLSKLRAELLNPIIAARNEAARKQEAHKIEENIKTLGEQIFDKKNELHQQYLEMNRQKKDTKDIEAKLEIMEWLVGKK
jgi:hypothetical protein